MPKSKSQKLLLYGCTGYIGRLTAQQVIKHSFLKDKVVLAGRSRGKVAEIAHNLHLPWRVFDLTHEVDIDKNLRDIGVVLNMAGPFFQTTPPLLAACLRTNTHYLDVTRETDIFQLLFKTLATAVRNSGIIAVPGVGFDVVPTDCLAAMLHEQLPSATHLALSFSFSNPNHPTAVSPGITKAAIHTLATRGPNPRSRVNGQLQQVTPFTKQRLVNFPNAGTWYVGPVPWFDCYTAYYSTNIQNIDNFVPMDPSVPTQSPWILYILSFFLQYFPIIQWLIFFLVDQIATGPSDEERDSTKIDVWAEARDEKTGECVRGCLQTVEGYDFASHAGLEAAVMVLQRDDLPAGVFTPSQAFSPGFVFKIPDTILYNFVKLQLPASASSYPLSQAKRQTYSNNPTERAVQAAAMLTMSQS